jgi:hypothetical protein
VSAETPWVVLKRAALRLRDVAPDVTGPLVGLAGPVADWLEHEITRYDPAAGIQETDGSHRVALAVARAVLGEEAPATPSDVDARQDAR